MLYGIFFKPHILILKISVFLIQIKYLLKIQYIVIIKRQFNLSNWSCFILNYADNVIQFTSIQPPDTECLIRKISFFLCKIPHAIFSAKYLLKILSFVAIKPVPASMTLNILIVRVYLFIFLPRVARILGLKLVLELGLGLKK